MMQILSKEEISLFISKTHTHTTVLPSLLLAEVTLTFSQTQLTFTLHAYKLMLHIRPFINKLIMEEEQN